MTKSVKALWAAGVVGTLFIGAALGSSNNTQLAERPSVETVKVIEVEKAGVVEHARNTDERVAEQPAPLRQQMKQTKPDLFLQPKTETSNTGSVNSDNNCNPNYSGCLRADASDYDCAGGSGNGPYYTGKVQVLGRDVYDLDRDNDGWGCEK